MPNTWGCRSPFGTVGAVKYAGSTNSTILPPRPALAHLWFMHLGGAKQMQSFKYVFTHCARMRLFLFAVAFTF